MARVVERRILGPFGLGIAGSGVVIRAELQGEAYTRVSVCLAG